MHLGKQQTQYLGPYSLSSKILFMAGYQRAALIKITITEAARKHGLRLIMFPSYVSTKRQSFMFLQPSKTIPEDCYYLIEANGRPDTKQIW